MVDDTTQFNIIFFYRECALCRQFLDPEDVNSFLAVSACHPSPGRAEWKEIDWSHLLCIGHAAASRIGVFDELPGVYLVHPCCNNVIATPNNNRSFFDCCHALGPVLHETHAPAAPLALVHVVCCIWPPSYAPSSRELPICLQYGTRLEYD